MTNLTFQGHVTIRFQIGHFSIGGWWSFGTGPLSPVIFDF